MLRHPDLPMRVGIASPHHRPTILKNLYVPEIRFFPQRAIFLRPHIHHPPDIPHIHPRQRQTVVGMKAHHPAPSPLPLRAQQLLRSAPTRLAIGLRRIGQQRRKVVVEDIRALILRRHLPARTRVPGTQVALGIVMHLREPRRLADFPLPRTRRSVWRHQHPRPPQRVIPAMRKHQRLSQTPS